MRPDVGAGSGNWPLAVAMAAITSRQSTIVASASAAQETAWGRPAAGAARPPQGGVHGKASKLSGYSSMVGRTPKGGNFSFGTVELGEELDVMQT